MLDLKHRIVLATGAAKRVGRAIALHFGESGAKTIIHFNKSKTEALEVKKLVEAMNCEAMIVSADLSPPVECSQMRKAVLQRFGHLDVLVNNAANFHMTSFDKGGDDQFEQLISSSLATNLVAPIRMSRLFADDLRNRQGAIINIVDIAGKIAWPEYVAHGAANAGLEHATRVLATTLGGVLKFQRLHVSL